MKFIDFFYNNKIKQPLNQLWLKTNTPEFQKQWKTAEKIFAVASIFMFFAVSGGYLIGSSFLAGTITHLAVCKLGLGLGCVASAIHAVWLSHSRGINLWGQGNLTYYLRCLAPRTAYILAVSTVGCWLGINPFLQKTNIFVLCLTGIGLGTIPWLDDL